MMVVYNTGKSDVVISHEGQVYVIEKDGSIDLPEDVARLYLGLIPGLSTKKPRKIVEVVPQDTTIAEVVPQETGEAEVVRDEEEPDLESMSKRELLDYAREHGYKVDGRKSRVDILASIKEQME